MATALFVAPSFAVSVIVEVSDDVETLVDARLARRLIRLELADVELPKVNSAVPATGPQKSSSNAEEVVFVRLLRQGETMVVELWARGELSGERRLAASDNERHQARRVALASAELARRLREVRVVERQRILRQHLAPSPRDGAPVYLTKVNVGLTAGITTAWWIGGDTLLIGPKVGLWGMTESGVGLGLTGAALTPARPGTVRSWSELAVRPSWGVPLNAYVRAEFGLQLAAAVLGIGPRAEFSGSDVSRQTWATKAVLDTRVEWLLGPRLSLVAVPEFGLVTRSLSVESRGETGTLEGTWLGVALGVNVYL